MSGDRSTVLTADHDRVWRRRVVSALAGSGFEVVAEVDDLAAAVEAARDLEPDVALLAVTIPGGGARAAEVIATCSPRTAVVAVAPSSSDVQLFAVIEAGARGCLPKDMDLRRLPSILSGVLEGEAALPRTMVSRLLQELRHRARGYHLIASDGGIARLSSREMEVLDRLREGQPTAQIAMEMFVAQVTVRTHVAAIVRKLRVPTRRDAVDLFSDLDGAVRAAGSAG